ncbi:MAG TPA: ABC transporter permease, partial [Longimicrobiales bacterium]|nr:ABC transporter permease [Longimicrobiales bacterium]
MSDVLRGARVVAWREILRLVGQRPRLVASIATPLLFFGLFGAGFNRLVGQILPGVDLITFMFPGIVAMTVIMPAVFTGMSVVWDREFGFLREVLVAPVSRTGIALGKVAGGALVATAEGLVILLLGPLVGVSAGVLRTGEVVGLMLLLAVLLSSFGILVGVRIRSQEAFQTVMA